MSRHPAYATPKNREASRGNARPGPRAGIRVRALAGWSGGTSRPRCTHRPLRGYGVKAARGRRVEPWFTISVVQGNAFQIGGLLGSVLLAWLAGRRGEGGTRLMVASRLLAYFSEHAFSHWLVGRAVGIRFTGYGLHGTSHPWAYPPPMRFVFSRLPLLSARVERGSLRTATPAARAAMYAAGTVGTVIPSLLIPGYCWRRGVRGARGFFAAANLWNVPLILSEALRPGGDLNRAWSALTDRGK